MKSTLIFGTLIMTGALQGLYAQVHSDPFREMDLSISFQTNINENLFHDYWRPFPGVSGSAGLPFYVGTVELNAGYGFFEGRAGNVPDIDQLQVSLGWVNRVKPAPRLRIGAGISLLGSVLFFKNISEENRMRARNLYGSTSPETEVGVGLKADLTYQLSSDWSVRISLKRDIVFTGTKLKLTYLGVGILKRFELPKWVSRVMK